MMIIFKDYNKLFLCFAILSVVFLVGYSMYKIEKMTELYIEGVQDLKNEALDRSSRIKSGELKLSTEKTAELIELVAERGFENEILFWFRRFLIVYSLIFGFSLLVILFIDFKRRTEKGNAVS